MVRRNCAAVVALIAVVVLLLSSHKRTLALNLAQCARITHIRKLDLRKQIGQPGDTFAASCLQNASDNADSHRTWILSNFQTNLVFTLAFRHRRWCCRTKKT